MNTRLLKILAALGCAATLSLGAVAPASAAIIVGTFDPQFGNGFTGLGWRGQVTIEMPDLCLALGNATALDAVCANTRITEVFVQLYDFPTKSTFDLLDFTGNLSLENFRLSGGSLAGLDGGMIDPPSGWVPPTGGLPAATVDPGYMNYLYGLSFVGPDVFLRASSTTVVDVGPPGMPDFRDSTFGCPFDGDYAICTSQFTPQVHFPQAPPPTGVPEPATLGLLAAALVSAAWARRRVQPSTKS